MSVNRIGVLCVLVFFRLGLPSVATEPEKDVDGRRAGRLAEMALVEIPHGLRFVIRADGTMEHRTYIQERPPRIVLDILNVRNPLTKSSVPEPKGVVTKIGSEEHSMSAYAEGETSATFGRVVLDLTESVEYRLRAAGPALFIELIDDTGLPERNDGENTVSEDEVSLEKRSAVVDEGASSGHLATIRPADIDPGLFLDSATTSPGEYRLGAEDIVEIRVFELDQLNRTVRVSGDGTMELPLVGTVPVSGLTPEQVASAIADRLRNRYVQDPQVSVFIKEFHSQQVSLIGAISKPATYSLVGRRSLLQALADAGGLSSDAGNLLYVFRRAEDGRSARLSIPLNELLVEGNPRWNVWLRAGDIVSVPPEAAVSVSVLGAVRNPGVYKLPAGGGASLLKAIARAGGLNDRASKGGVQIKRAEGRQDEKIFKVDLGDVLAGKKPDVVLQEGDVVVVRESFF